MKVELLLSNFCPYVLLDFDPYHRVYIFIPDLKEAQSKYDSALAGYEVGRATLEREFAQIRTQHTSERAEFHIQRATLENLHSLQDRLQDADTWRDVLNRKLLESERRSKV